MPVPTYANFHLLSDRSPAGHRSRVIHSPADEARVIFDLPKVSQ